MGDVIISKQDIIAIIVGIALLLTGNLTEMVITNFQNASNTTMTNYVTSVLGYLPEILEIAGIGMLVVVAIHYIRALMRTPETV